MARPDDDHLCQPLYDEHGDLTAVVHGDPGMSPQARAALAELVEAARRRFEADDAASGGELSSRQAAAQQRIRERNARLLGD